MNNNIRVERIAPGYYGVREGRGTGNRRGRLMAEVAHRDDMDGSWYVTYWAENGRIRSAPDDVYPTLRDALAALNDLAQG